MRFIGLILLAVFLVCDWYAQGDSVNQFEVTQNGVTTMSPAQVESGTNRTRLYWDISTLADGTYTMSIKAVNVWGQKSIAAPFVFTKGIPAAPKPSMSSN